MKHTFRLLLFTLITLAGFAPLHAQWEKIGWEGGGQVEIKAQLGNTLYGIANYSVYKSTDWGKSWNFFHDGLPQDSFFCSNLQFTVRNHTLFIEFYPPLTNLYDLFKTGAYFCNESDNKWSFKEISQINGSQHNHILFWSGDSVFVFRGLGTDSHDGYYFSPDGGISWQNRMIGVTGPSFYGFYDPYSFRSFYLISVVGKNLRTKDLGITWDSIGLPAHNSSVISDSIILHYYSDSLISGLFRSSDFGFTWNIVNDFGGENPDLQYSYIIKTIGKKCFIIHNLESSTYHKEYVSDDLGEHWKRIIALDSAIEVLDIFGKTNFYIFVTSIGNFTTDSSFATFTPLVSNEKGVMANDRTLVGVIGRNLFGLPDARKHTFYDSLMISTDNGSTWSQELFFNKNKLDNHRWFIDRNQVYASGIQKDSLPCLFRTSDEGKSWVIETTFSSKDSIRQFFVQNDTIVVTRKKDFLISIDGGLSWISDAYPQISDSVNMTYRNGKTIFLNLNTGIITYSVNLFQWVSENPFYSSPNQVYGPYIFGDRWFVYIGKGSNTPYLFYGIFEKTGSREGAKGIPNNFMVTLPNCDDGSVIYATNYNRGSPWTSQGRTALYYSLDSGSKWKQLGDYVTNSPDVFIGSDYIFLAGPTELWRGPKPTIPSGVAQTKSIPSITINECYPNPAKSEMRISYSIPKRSDVVLNVFDITGKEITTIASEAHDAGSYEKLWNVGALPNGSYILKLTACGESMTKVVEVVK